MGGAGRISVWVLPRCGLAESEISDADPSVLMFPGGRHPLIRDFQSM